MLFRLSALPSLIICMVAALTACTVAPASSPSATPSVRQAAQPTPSPSEVSLPPGVHRYRATELRPGDCIDPLPDDFMVTVVPCDRPHVAEFATTYVIPDGPFPGMGICSAWQRTGGEAEG